MENFYTILYLEAIFKNLKFRAYYNLDFYKLCFHRFFTKTIIIHVLLYNFKIDFVEPFIKGLRTYAIDPFYHYKYP